MGRGSDLSVRVRARRIFVEFFLAIPAAGPLNHLDPAEFVSLLGRLLGR
jgi:hypothetical protein